MMLTQQVDSKAHTVSAQFMAPPLKEHFSQS